MSNPTQHTPALRPPPRRILEDASGRRLHRMRWVGRIVAILFLVWIVIIVLGGLGVGPAGRLPLGHVLQPSSGPPAIRRVPRPVQPAPADLAPALPAAALPPVGAATRATTHRTKPAAAAAATRGRSASAPGHTKTTKTTTTVAVHGRSATAPRRSATAPGRVKHSTTTVTTTVSTVPGNGHARGKKH